MKDRRKVCNAKHGGCFNSDFTDATSYSVSTPPSGENETFINTSTHTLCKHVSCFHIRNSEPTDLSLASCGAVVSGSLTE